MGLRPSTGLAATAADAEATGFRAVLTAWDGAVHAVFVLGGTVRASAPRAVEHLRALGPQAVLVTSLPQDVAAPASAHAGIDQVVGDLPAHETVAVLRHLQQQGHTVAVVADPAEGAEALAAAASLAVCQDRGVAPQSVDVTLDSRDIWATVDALRLCGAVRRAARTNLFWAFSYNLAALPVAAAGLLNPMVAGAAMTVSTIFVLANSQRLRRFRSLRPPAHRPRG